MKKRLYFVFIFFVCSLCLAARNYKSNISVEIFTSVENISDSEKNWLGDVIEEKLESNISKYTDYSLVNNANKKQIFDIQKKSESAAFDESSVIEAGKLTTATHGIFLMVRKTNSNYAISVRFTNLTTGESLAVVSRSKKNIEDLYAYNGCAIDEISLELFEQLGINLSATDKHIILNGDVGLSADEKNKLYKDDIELYSSQIKNIEKEINTLDISSADINKKIMQQKLETEKALAEEKLKVARENQKRALEEEKKRMADEVKDAERSEAQKNRINAMSEELNTKLQSVMNKKFDKESVLSQIKIIELKKKALVEVQQEIDGERNEILDFANDLIAKKKNEINNREPRTVEKDRQGNLTESAIANRKKEIEIESERILKQAQEDIKQIKDKIDKHNSDLLKEIYDDYSKLGSRNISTLGGELSVTYSNYDGNLDGWNLNITVKSDDVIIFQTTSFLSYEEHTGKKPVKNYNDGNFEDFANEVDYYESLFQRGEPILTYEIDYSVKPLSLNHPSEYLFSFNTLKYYDTKDLSIKGDKIKSSKSGILFLDDSQIIRKMIPAYDLSGFENIGNYDYDVTVPDYAINDSGTGTVNNLISRKGKETKGRTLFGMSYGFMGSSMPGSSIEFNFSSAINPYVFAGFNFDIMIPSSPTYYPVNSSAPVVLSNSHEIGANYEFEWGVFKPNVFASAGIGVNYFSSSTNISEENSKIDCIISLIAGVDLPVVSSFGFVLDYGVNFILGTGIEDEFNIGCAFLLPDSF